MTKDRAKAKAALYLEWAGKAEAKSAAIYAAWCEVHRDFDWTQPILRGHHSQRRHEKVYERRASMHNTIRELDDKAKRFREKAENLTIFANTHKGDAERRREAVRAANDMQIVVGSKVYDPCFRAGTVLKVNVKTYTIEWASGSVFTRDKYFMQLA